MVTIHFKLTDIGRLEVRIEAPVPLAPLLRQCTGRPDFAVSGIIAIRNGRVLQGSDLVQDGDAIEVFPALSGG